MTQILLFKSFVPVHKKKKKKIDKLVLLFSKDASRTLLHFVPGKNISLHGLE